MQLLLLLGSWVLLHTQSDHPEGDGGREGNEGREGGGEGKEGWREKDGYIEGGRCSDLSRVISATEHTTYCA